MLGLIWVADESGRMAVFLIGAVMAVMSLGLSILIPTRPEPGNETTVWRSGVVLPAE
jgi:hypothetical protein